MRLNKQNWCLNRGKSVCLGALLVALVLAFWRVRIIDSATVARVSPLVTGDLYSAHLPMASYGFASLRAGRLPLWNPYQLCGLPFLAEPITGLFYPLNIVYVFYDTASATDVSLVMHMLLGVFGMWWFTRHLGLGQMGAFAAALTFIWSGFLVARVHQPQLHAAMSWMPLVILQVDRVILNRRLAWLGLIGAAGCQILIGAMEVVIHTVYAASFLVAGRMLCLLGRRECRGGLVGGALACGCVCMAACLAAAQLFPALEMVQLSARAPGSLTLEEATSGAIPLWQFLYLSVAGGMSLVTTGPWTVFAVGLALGSRRYRLVGMFAMAAAAASAVLVFGGALFNLYHETPVGSLFRRPMKFLDVYCFGQAVVAGVGVAALRGWIDVQRSILWRKPAWILVLVIAVAAAAWLIGRGDWSPYLLATLVLLVLFGVAAGASWRGAAVVAICAVQAAGLFFEVGNKEMRPSQRPHLLALQKHLLKALPARAPHARVYVSQLLSLGSVLPPKQGMLNGVEVVNDYEPLATARQARFFNYVAERPEVVPFYGQFMVGAKTHWRLLDLTGTQYFFMRRGEPGQVFMKQNPRQFRLVKNTGQVLLYRRLTGFNKRRRLYFVPRARVAHDPEQALRLLDRVAFRPDSEVILEDRRATRKAMGARRAQGKTRFLSYQPERVLVSAEVDQPGFLVLTDLFYPGWVAIVDGREAPIYRANYLFRAVWLPAGRHKISFQYRPASLRIGALVSATTACLIILLVVWDVRRARRRG